MNFFLVEQRVRSVLMNSWYIIKNYPDWYFVFIQTNENPVLDTRRFMMEMMNRDLDIPVILAVECQETTIDRQLIHFAVEAGALLADGMGDGIWLINDPEKISERQSQRKDLPGGK